MCVFSLEVEFSFYESHQYAVKKMRLFNDSIHSLQPRAVLAFTLLLHVAGKPCLFIDFLHFCQISWR